METFDGYKDAICGCNTCRSHETFHREHEIERKAREFALKTKKVGISLPVSDPSDYCLSEKGILFFEMSEFQPDKTVKYLEEKNELTQNERRALNLTKRYQQLQSQTQVDAFTGKLKREWNIEESIV
jgi:hypothetical protein